MALLLSAVVVFQDQLCVHALCSASFMQALSTFLDSSTTKAAGTEMAPTMANV